MKKFTMEDRNRATIDAVSNITCQHVHDFILLFSGKDEISKVEYDLIECFVDTFIETSRYCALDDSRKGESMGLMFDRVKSKIKEIGVSA